VVAAAARLCYSASNIDTLLQLEPDAAARLIRKVLGLGHLSVLEHVTCSFGIEGISRACSHQLVRHRVASYSQQSQRYVSHKEPFEAVLPKSVKDDPALSARFEELMGHIHTIYAELLDAGVPAEDARFVLPNAATTKIVVSMNARELHHFFALRCCRRAQWEIRAMATQMLHQCRTLSPVLFEQAGPPCLDGPCPEGSMTCGAIQEVRREFGSVDSAR
jgi:thymidylate synthase (FAD)